MTLWNVNMQSIVGGLPSHPAVNVTSKPIRWRHRLTYRHINPPQPTDYFCRFLSSATRNITQTRTHAHTHAHARTHTHKHTHTGAAYGLTTSVWSYVSWCTIFGPRFSLRGKNRIVRPTGFLSDFNILTIVLDFPEVHMESLLLQNAPQPYFKQDGLDFRHELRPKTVWISTYFFNAKRLFDSKTEEIS